MSEKSRKWDKKSQQDSERNRRRFDRDQPYDYNREVSGDIGNTSNYRNRMRRNFDEAGNTGSSGNYASDYPNQNWQQEQNSGFEYRNRNSGNQYGYNTGYGNRYNRQDNWSQGQGGYSSGMYGSEYPGYKGSGSGYGANSGYLGGQGRYNAYENEGNYENMNRGDYDRDWWDKTRDEVSSWFGDEDAERRRNADRQMAGMHRGKGPKGYTRSDQRIQEDVCDRLSDDDRLDASNIEVKVQEGEVVLTGTVIDREQKRRAEDLVERISGVRDVENHIKVKKEDRDTYSSIR